LSQTLLTEFCNLFNASPSTPTSDDPSHGLSFHSLRRPLTEAVRAASDTTPSSLSREIPTGTPKVPAVPVEEQ
jgi:hypothetical protein